MIMLECVSDKLFSSLSFIIYSERLSEYIYDNDDRNFCAGLFRDSFHRPVCSIIENKRRLLHNQLGVSLDSEST